MLAFYKIYSEDSGLLTCDTAHEGSGSWHFKGLLIPSSSGSSSPNKKKWAASPVKKVGTTFQQELQNHLPINTVSHPKRLESSNKLL